MWRLVAQGLPINQQNTDSCVLGQGFGMNRTAIACSCGTHMGIGNEQVSTLYTETKHKKGGEQGGGQGEVSLYPALTLLSNEGTSEQKPARWESRLCSHLGMSTPGRGTLSAKLLAGGNPACSTYGDEAGMAGTQGPCCYHKDLCFSTKDGRAPLEDSAKK